MQNETSPLLLGSRRSAGRKEEDDCHEPVQKEIDSLGSFTLLINNMVGPAMLGIPRLYQQAGIVPTTCCIAFIYFCATLSGTLFADAISSIPGNKTFDRHVDFSTAFQLVIGTEFYIVAETLFLITCAVQAIAAIVESAQSVDGILASFILGKTYALQLYPSVEIVSWVPDLCIKDENNMNDGEMPIEDCTPFSGAGSMIISMGFIITALIFLPLGRGHLKETILIQICAFSFMCLLLVQFSGEFIVKGFPYSNSVPYFGESISQLAGVVLFNYAYIVTVPSWLNEKQNSVSVNNIVWTASTLSSAIYIAFGIMCAMSFSDLSGNALVMLASTKVHLFTRICAALFGVTIIGSGVPVFCVMIRTAIFHSGAVSYDVSLFLGSVLPYLISWMLYQGSALMAMLNWTGLVVNGFVAFILPMYLVLKSMQVRHLSLSRSNSTVQDQQSRQEDIQLVRLSNPPLQAGSSGTSPVSDVWDALKTPQQSHKDSNGTHGTFEGNSGVNHVHSRGEVDPSLEDSSVQPLPPSLEYLRFPLVLLMMLCFVLIIGATIFLDIYFGIQPE